MRQEGFKKELQTEHQLILISNLHSWTRAEFTYGQDWAVAQGPPQPGGLHIFHGKKL